MSHCITVLTYSDTAELHAQPIHLPCLEEHYHITIVCWQPDVRVHVTDMVPVRWRMGNITVSVQMVGLVWTAVFVSRWNAMMKLTMMKVRIGDILISGGHHCVPSKTSLEHNSYFEKATLWTKGQCLRQYL
jgi:hypothetical protein